jgi:hypothetical protein
VIIFPNQPMMMQPTWIGLDYKERRGRGLVYGSGLEEKFYSLLTLLK